MLSMLKLLVFRFVFTISMVLLSTLADFSEEWRDNTLKQENNSRERDLQSRIVGGTGVINIEAYRFFASWEGKCGGSLIHPEWILSAAHCSPSLGKKIVINAFELDDNNLPVEDTYTETRQIAEEFLHPEYDDDTMENDFILIKLNQPSSKKPIELNGDARIPSDRQSLKVIGLGTISDGGEQAKVLQEVIVQAMEDDKCNTKFYNGKVSKDDMFCAAASGKDACQGDSGGPIFTFDPTGKYLRQVGVVSWGYGCADPRYPGVYAEVSFVRNWIDCTICQNSRNAEDECNRCSRGPTIHPPTNLPTTLSPTSFPTTPAPVTPVPTTPSPTTSRPTRPPTPPPTSQPTSRPTPPPTSRPTAQPTSRPTPPPTPPPTSQPTSRPTPPPTSRPTAQPTPHPTNIMQPTHIPTTFSPPTSGPTPIATTISPTPVPPTTPAPVTAGPTVLASSSPTAEVSTTCVDYPSDWTDEYGDRCSWYENHNQCYHWDEGQKEACCACGGGQKISIVPTPAPTNLPATCVDWPSNWTDSYGDSCSWYEEHDECGIWFEGEMDVCCFCGGGYREMITTNSTDNNNNNTPECVDNLEWVDKGNDDCTWYEQHKWACGYFNDGEIENCCVCQDNSQVL